VLIATLLLAAGLPTNGSSTLDFSTLKADGPAGVQNAPNRA
jgi:hypothetical protein